MQVMNLNLHKFGVRRDIKKDLQHQWKGMVERFVSCVFSSLCKPGINESLKAKSHRQEDLSFVY